MKRKFKHCDGQQFHQYQQNEKKYPLNFTHWTRNTTYPKMV